MLKKNFQKRKPSNQVSNIEVFGLRVFKDEGFVYILLFVVFVVTYKLRKCMNMQIGGSWKKAAIIKW